LNDPLAVPWKPVDYWPYAGITRSAWLEVVPTVTIAKVLVSARGSRFEARVVVANHGTRPFSGTVVIRPGHGSASDVVPVKVAAGEVVVVASTLDITGAPPWQPDRPRLLRA